MAIDSFPPNPGTKILPDTHEEARRGETKRRHKEYDPGVIDPTQNVESRADYDPSLKASHDRLTRSLALITCAIERKAKTNKSPDLAAEIVQAANAWRTLMSTQPKADPLDQQPGESEEDYRTRLEQAAK